MSYDGTDQIPGSGDPYQAAGPGPHGQPVGQAATRELVRDPYSRLGGVASGLAHYLGLDVSIVRLGFVLFTIFSSGAGLIVYLLAWLVVPRAEYWPPVSGARPIRSITGREVGIGMAVLGALLFLFFSGGGTAQILVPVLLVAGGVWLLRQPDAIGGDGTSLAGQDPFAGPLAYPAPDEATRVAEDLDPTLTGDPFADDPFSSPGAPQPIDTIAEPRPVAAAAPTTTRGGRMAPGTPVPPRRRRWRRVVLALFFLFILIPGLLIALVIGLILGNGININAGFDSVYRPDSISDIPTTIDQDAGAILLDLTSLDPDDFVVPEVPEAPEAPDAPGGAELPTPPEPPELPDLPELPVPIAIDMGFGEVRVVVPEGLDIEVVAQADLGDVEVFDEFEEGIDNEVTYRSDESPVIELEIDLGAGDITVERAS
ncbi:MAG: PspC domain-containing protein [Actinomycetota bacterium]